MLLSQRRRNFGVRTLAVLVTILGTGAVQAQITRPAVGGVNGFGGYGFGVAGAAPTGVGVVGGAAVANPYALSTAPAYNPYLGTGSMGMSPMVNPYGLSTNPGFGGFPFFPGFPYVDTNLGLGFAYQGIASMVQAEGQYQMSIQQARILREQSRQMGIETARRRLEFEQWYEANRPTYAKIRERDMATDLDMARKDASDTEVASGKALNILLRSIQSAGSGRIKAGPSIALEDDVVKRINLSSGSSTGGNVGLIKDAAKPGFKLPWPEGLMDTAFDKFRAGLDDNLHRAADRLSDPAGKGPVERSVMTDINNDFKALRKTFDERFNDLTPTQFIETQKFLNQLQGAIRALSDPNARKYFNNTWSAKGRTVGELIQSMTSEGLTFNAATPGDEAAYRAMYQALRQFEAGLATASR